MWKMTSVPSRIAPARRVPGCGYFPTFHQISRVLEGDIVVLYQTGCAMVVTTGYPNTAHRVNYVHNLFQNGAATLSGWSRCTTSASGAGSCRRATTSRSS
jgi:pyruvate ferredoxin oxidoreductase alpha subunit